MFKQVIKTISDKLENILKIGSYTKVNGSDGNLQDIQLKTLRNIEDAMKVGQFGFNSKAPLESRCIVAKIGNENIVIVNEHIASIIDISSGNTVIYNESGHTIKIEGETITTTAPNVVTDCDNFTINSTDTTVNSETTTINASSKFTVNSPISEFSAAVNVFGLFSAANFSGLSGASMTTNVNLETTADVRAGAISLNSHTHSQESDSAGNTQAETNTPS